MPKINIYLILLFLFLALPQMASAHSIGGQGFTSGIVHPLFGLDHLLAMVAVGIISTQNGGKAIWKVPVIFVCSMIIGATLAVGGFSSTITEYGIALSVLFLGLVITFSKVLPINLVTLLIAFFAIFHGHAHGEELPIIANPALYAIGFTISTAVLHMIGAAIGHYAHKTKFTFRALRFAGAGISTLGIIFLLGI